MKVTIRTIASAFLVTLAYLIPLFAQAPAQQQQPEYVKQGQQLIRDGKPEEALALYRQTLQTSPNSVPANIAAGSVLDLTGKSEEARKYFTKAIDAADTPEGKVSAQRAIAMSYAFEGDCKKTIEYEQRVFDFYGSVNNFFQQGGSRTRRLAFASIPAIWMLRIGGTSSVTTRVRRNPTSRPLAKTYGISGGSTLRLASLPGTAIK